ncbi:hypothetical protein [Mycolicibacterium sp. 120270]|uniref:hypothetical protein n=1 Tax=Mycolicibacterium sp. 120270 TaxID=3090600 RepID=UPI00299E128F|nr:hypothetical protein [Mycolicibacterium sp. 120270]MDX1882712.1 hypothetical protein [Mycolicibacterium sp. 120270]
MEWVFLALGVVLGIGGNLAANLAQNAIDTRRERKQFGPVNIEGVFAEWVPDSKGRQFSIGQIRYVKSSKRYDLDGTNYRNDGEPFCRWRTVASSLDLRNRQYHYVFVTTNFETPNTNSYGYGVIYLDSQGDGLEPVDGYYVYVDDTQWSRKAISVSHTMDRIHSMPESRNANMAELIDQIYPGKRIV